MTITAIVVPSVRIIINPSLNVVVTLYEYIFLDILFRGINICPVYIGRDGKNVVIKAGMENKVDETFKLNLLKLRMLTWPYEYNLLFGDDFKIVIFQTLNFKTLLQSRCIFK